MVFLKQHPSLAVTQARHILFLAAITAFHCGYTKLAPSKPDTPPDAHTIWVRPAENQILEYRDTIDIEREYVVIGAFAAKAAKVSESQAMREALRVAQKNGADAVSNIQFSIKTELYMDAGYVDVTHADGLLIKFSDNIIPVGRARFTFELPTTLYHRIVVRSLLGNVVEEKNYRPGNTFVFDPAGLEDGVYGIYTWSGDVERSPGGSGNSYSTYFETTTWVRAEGRGK